MLFMSAALEHSVSNFSGWLSVTSSDASAVYPASYFMTPGQAGTVFTGLQWRTSGTQWLRVFSVNSPAIQGTESNIVVAFSGTGGAFDVSMPPAALAGVWASFTVTAIDDRGLIDSNYLGTVHFTANAAMPANLTSDYTFQPEDKGVKVFTNGVRFSMRGEGSFTVKDTLQVTRMGMGATRVFAGGATTTTHLLVEIPDEPLLNNEAYDMMIVALDDDELVNASHTAAVMSSTISASFSNNPCSLFTNGIAFLKNSFVPLSPGFKDILTAQVSDTNVCGVTRVFVSANNTRYYVGKDGSDALSGTHPTNAFGTITHAALCAGPGDVVVVMPGVYNESVQITNSGTAGNYITFVADTRGRYSKYRGPVKIDSGSVPAFNCQANSHIQIVDFSMAGSGAADGIRIQNGANYRIVGNRIEGCSAGIKGITAPGIVIAGNSIDLGGPAGIDISMNSHDADIYGNQVANCDDGIVVWGSTNAAVHNNQVFNNRANGIQFTLDSNGKIFDNMVVTNNGAGIVLNSVNTGADIFQNIILRNRGPAIRINSLPGPNIIRNNTCVENEAGVHIPGALPAEIYNNIFAFNTAGITNFGGAAITNDYNCFWNVSDFAGLATQGVHDIVATPQFAGPEDFHLQSSAGRPGPAGPVFDALFSPCIDAGDPAILPDFEPFPNGQRINIGKYGNTPEASHSPTLTVRSPYGNPMPPTNAPYDPGLSNTVSCFITSSPEPDGIGTQYICTGWNNGMGNIAPSGGGTNAGTFALTKVSKITWLWQTQHIFTINASPGGTVNYTSGWYNATTVFTIVPTASNGYQFAGWSGDVSAANTNDNPLVLTNDKTRVVTANYTTTMYTIATTAGVNGVIIPAGPVLVPHNATTNFHIRPDPFYYVTNLSVDGVTVANATNYTFVNVTNNHSIAATFAINTYPVTIVPGANGRTVPAGTVWVNHGSDLLITFTPSNYYTITNILIDAVSVGTPSSYTITNISAAHSVSSFFAILTFPLTIQSFVPVVQPAVGTTFRPWNTPITAMVTNNPVRNGSTQYVCTGWTRTGSAPGSGTGTNTSFNLVTNTIMRWNWSTRYQLNAFAGPNGRVTGTPNGFYPAGASAISVTAIPSNGYHFVNWTGAAVPATPTLNLTMTRPFLLMANFAPDIGFVQVNINPIQVTANARWRLTTGADTNWQNHGAALGVAPGIYSIDFSPVAGWTRPATISNVAISNNLTTLVSITYPRGRMVYIPRGTFMMGNYNGAGGHQVTLGAYYIDSREVTIGDFTNFVRATGYRMPPQPADWEGDLNRPVTRVTWADAVAYAAWVGKRLPTEAQWEFAARGTLAGALYPWGDSISPALANYGLPGGMPQPAGSYPATGRGLFDIAGNVWEWCQDWYTSQLTGPVVNPQGPSSGTYRCVRGGSYASAPFYLQNAIRSYYAPGVSYRDLGFRCAQGAHPASDGISFIAPTNVLMITSMRINPAGQGFIIQWESIAGRTYTVERCTTFADGFVPIVTGLTATPPVNSYTDTSATLGTCLYRIRETL